MSFSGLRASRKTKSYVDAGPAFEQNSGLSSKPGKNEARLSQVTAASNNAASDAALPKGIPSTVEVRTSEQSGRGIYSQTQLTSGTVLLSVRPPVAVLSTDQIDNHCALCFSLAPPAGLKKCTQCRRAHYCDATCQSEDWSVHKQECIALQRWAAAAPSPDLATPSDAVRGVARMLWMRQRKGLDSLWSRELDAMQSHRRNLPVSAAELHTHLAQALVQYMGLSSPKDLVEYGISSAGDLLDVTSRFTTNTFAVTDPTLTPLGVSVSPLVALFNHSCNPNAVVVFPRASTTPRTSEPLMQVVVLRDILPGQEVLTAYIDTILPRKLRQKSLKETYNFDCRCELCDHPPSVDPREAMRCPKSCGGTCPLPTEDDPLTRCDRCRSVVSSTDEVLDAVRVGQQGLDKATALQFQDPAKALQLTSKLIPILTSAGLTPSSHPLLGLILLQKSFPLPEPLTQDALDDAIRVGNKALTGLLGIHVEGHPVVGIALAELGKLLAVDEPSPLHINDTAPSQFPPSGPPRLKMAYDTLMRARASLMVGFGRANEGGQVGKQVRDILSALEKEIGVWRQGVKNVLNDTPRI